MVVTKNNYRVGIYTRLSIDDRTDGESVSIDTQKKILTEFVRNKGWQIAKMYVDDGYSGGNFDRPDFQRMIQDIENKEIDCVITKDLSRLGRNYIDCGFYLEIYFPEHQVRYIAVNDGVDTINNTSMDITPFKNILNEMYVKDISVKVSSARKVRLKDGKCMTTLTPYGYLKDINDHNHLVVDPETAPIIKLIYEMYYSGKGTTYISNYLEKNKIIRPSEYYYRKGFIKTKRKVNKGFYFWSNKTILDILSNPVYTGAVVGGKSKKVSPKSKKKIMIPSEQWVIVENMHEPIISKELFDNVQRIRSSNKLRYENKMSEDRYDNIFRRIIRCPQDRNMVCRKIDCKGNSVDIENRKYCCNDKCPFIKECKSITIRAEKLYNIVLADINQYTNEFCNNKENYNLLEKKLEELNTQNTKMYENEKNKIEKRLDEIKQLITSSYEDKVFNKITEEMFTMIVSKYQQEQIELKDKLSKAIENIEEIKQNNQNAVNFTQLLKEFNGIKKLTMGTIINLIDKITIFPSEIIVDKDGNKIKTQKIEISYRYIGCISPTTIEFETLNYRTRYKDRTCEMCGATFSPTTSRQKFCVSCKKEAEKIRRKQRYREKLKAQGGNKGYREKVCELCGNTYKPNSSCQKYCSDCKEKGREKLKREWYIKKKEIRQKKKEQKEIEKQRKSA